MTTNNVNPHAVSDGPRWNHGNSVMLYLPPKLASCVQQIGVELVKAGVPKVVLSDLAASLLSASNDLDTPYTEEDFQNALKEWETLDASAKCDADLEQCIAKLQAAVAELEDGPPVPSTRKILMYIECHLIASRLMVVEVPASCSDGDIANLSNNKLSDIWSSYSDVLKVEQNGNEDDGECEDESCIVKYDLRYVGHTPTDSETDIRLSDDLSPMPIGD